MRTLGRWPGLRVTPQRLLNSDRFKEYYISDRSKCQLLLENLVSGLSSENAAYVKLLWERNVRLLPYAEYSKEEVFLIKTDYLFTEEERKAQKELVRSYSEQTSKYFLPEGIVYEKPVFYFEHGLKTLSEAELKFVKEGGNRKAKVIKLNIFQSIASLIKGTPAIQ